VTLFIAICDDEKTVGADLERAVMRLLDSMEIMYKIDVFFSGETLCRHMESGAHYNLIFLDIEFAKNAINGVQVGSLIRQAYLNDMVAIVYISWEQKYAMQLFDIRPFHFLLKPLHPEKVEQVIRAYLRLNGLWTGDFNYKIGHDTHKVTIKNIVYLHSVSRKLHMYLADGRREEFYGALKDVYREQLQRFDFLFIHAAYAVNYDYIATVKYDELILTTHGTSLPISQPKRKEVRERYCAITERRRV
jgi:DNA-binding LytR/AlgR family response regulator